MIFINLKGVLIIKEKELFKYIIDDCITNNDMSAFYMLSVSLGSADNNITEEEIKENCRLIDILIDTISEYEDNSELQNFKRKLIEYNNIYSDKRNIN